MECLACQFRTLRLSGRRTSSALLRPRPHITDQRRTEATARRLRKALRVGSAPIFTPAPEIKQDHIIYNPPPSAPSVYHTPQAFLPRSDPRRRLSTAPQKRTPLPSSSPSTACPTSNPASAQSSSSKSDSAAQQGLQALARARSRQQPPRDHFPHLGAIVAGAPPARKTHLTEADVAEIRRLRAADPGTWTVKALARHFDCGEFFVRLCAPNEEAGKEAERVLEEQKARWGRTRREAREERGRRRELWGVA